MGWTYTTLKQAIQDFSEYAESTFTANLDNFIKSAEERLLYAVELDVFKKNATGTCGVGSKYLAVPTDYLAPFALKMTYGGTDSYVMLKDVEWVADHSIGGATGRPKYYAPYDVDNFILSPTPDVAYVAELSYFYRPESIVTAGSTWLGDNAEQALLYACLVEAYIFMKGEKDIIDEYKMRFNEAVMRLKNHGEARENSDAYRYGIMVQRKT
jgi:hypothetical protein